eukprot:TRINITY_DN29669_c0_g1_i1.p1 TRINITY_DN29669_c0_g1~~TRINITY_DN29669_c0_g1_i1.p1  ORF type:complete len:362 (+),score=178.69 TRINITY_DN29669_c0_g1_i1:64-1149(+)
MVGTHTTTGGLVRNAPKNHRAKVQLKKVLPKKVENPKTAIFLKGERCSQVVQNVLTDFASLKKPFAVKMTKKNEFRPFEEAKHLEFLAFKNDASLFAFGNHQKKRPHNLILGRHFDYQLLDMIELGITKYEGIRPEAQIAIGSKPLLCFQGELFHTNPTLTRVKNIFADFFRGRVVDNLNLIGLDHAIAVTLVPKDASKEITVSEDGSTINNGLLLFRHYHVSLKKSGTKVPKTELVLVGPTIDFEIRRTQFANPQMMKHACKQPKGMVSKLGKNITRDGLGEQYGQVHLEGQTAKLATMGTRKFKAFKVKKGEAADAAAGEAADTPRPNLKRKRSSGMGGMPGGEEGPAVMPNVKKPRKK